jgi:hypothetical protein
VVPSSGVMVNVLLVVLYPGYAGTDFYVKIF